MTIPDGVPSNSSYKINKFFSNQKKDEINAALREMYRQGTAMPCDSTHVAETENPTSIWYSDYDSNKNEKIESSDEKFRELMKTKCNEELKHHSDTNIHANVKTKINSFIENALEKANVCIDYTATRAGKDFFVKGTHKETDSNIQNNDQVKNVKQLVQNAYNKAALEAETEIKKIKEEQQNLTKAQQTLAEKRQDYSNWASEQRGETSLDGKGLMPEMWDPDKGEMVYMMPNLQLHERNAYMASYKSLNFYKSASDEARLSGFPMEKLDESINAWGNVVDIDHGAHRRAIAIEYISPHNVIEVLNAYEGRNPGHTLLGDIGEEHDATVRLKERNYSLITANRISEAKRICNCLIVRAMHTKGIPIDKFNWYKNELDKIYKEQKEAFNYDFSQFDTAVKGLSALIKAYEATPMDTIVDIHKMDNKTKNGMALFSAQSTYDNAISSFKYHIDKEGCFSKSINGIQEIGNDILDYCDLPEFFITRKITKDTLQDYSKDLNRLGSALNGTLTSDLSGQPISFEQEFQRIYGMQPDAVAIVNFNNVKDKYQQYCIYSSRANSAETIANGIHPTRTIYTTQGPFGMGGAATYEAQEADFNNSYEKILNYFGGEENLKIACEALNISFPLSGTPKEKLEVLKTLMQNESKMYSNSAKEASGSLSGAQMKEKYDSAYTAAYGTQNDAAKAVSEYVDSQASALAFVKGLVITAVMAIPGGAIVTGFCAAGASLLFDSIEAGTNNVAETEEEKAEILKTALKTGITVGTTKYIVNQISINNNSFKAECTTWGERAKNMVKGAYNEGVEEFVENTTEELVWNTTERTMENTFMAAGEGAAKEAGGEATKYVTKKIGQKWLLGVKIPKIFS